MDFQNLVNLKILGSDHALLPTFLAASNRCAHIYAVD